jgi:hypothetical protein
MPCTPSIRSDGGLISASVRPEPAWSRLLVVPVVVVVVRCFAGLLVGGSGWWCNLGACTLTLLWLARSERSL